MNCNTMANLEIIKSSYEGKTSEENGKNLAHLWKLRDGEIITFEQIVDSKPVTDCML